MQNLGNQAGELESCRADDAGPVDQRLQDVGEKHQGLGVGGREGMIWVTRGPSHCVGATHKTCCEGVL